MPTLVTFGGFDGFGASEVIGLFPTSAGFPFSSNYKRTGDRGIALISGAGIHVNNSFPNPVVGYARNMFSSGSSDLKFYANGLIVFQVSFNQREELIVDYTDSFNVLQRQVIALPMRTLNTWRYVEISFGWQSSPQHIYIRIDSVPVLSLPSVDATHFLLNASHAISLVDFFGNGIFFDDFYTANLSGTPATDFFGDIRVRATKPNGAGAVTMFAPVGAAQNFECVDDPNDADNDTTYVAASALNDEDSYTIEDSVGTGTIIGLRDVIKAKVTGVSVPGSDPEELSLVLRTGATVDVTPVGNLAVNDIYAMYEAKHFLNPDTGVAWTQADIDALEIGQKITSLA